MTAWTWKNGQPHGVGLEILARIAAGADDCTIAAELDVSRKTVAAHRKRVEERIEEARKESRRRAVMRAGRYR